MQMSNKMAPSYRDLPDLELLEVILSDNPAVKGENTRAWAEFVRRFRGLIYRCINKSIAKFDSVLPSEAADEIFSEVCFNLLRNNKRKLRLYDPERGSKLSSWIGLIAVNSSYDHLRSCARQPMLDQIDGTPDRVDDRPSPLDNLLKKEQWVRLSELAADFSARDRRFMELYYHRGLSPSEIALRMEISVKTVYSKKNKIRKRLLAMSAGERQSLAA
jgi:RNA polymerase sigma-70 factor (ECF subfamily)